MSRCQRDDSRDREVAFYVHVTWRDPARISPRGGRMLGGGDVPGTHEGIRTRCEYYRREKLDANVDGISRSFFPGEHAAATGVRKAEWEREEAGEERRVRPSLTEGLERDWKSQSVVSSEWRIPPSRPLSLLAFSPGWSNVATGRRIIKEIHSLTCFLFAAL